MPNSPEIPHLVRIELAGECVRCTHFYHKRAEYTMTCLSCSRYHGDKFSPREEHPAFNQLPLVH